MISLSFTKSLVTLRDGTQTSPIKSLSATIWVSFGRNALDWNAHSHYLLGLGDG